MEPTTIIKANTVFSNILPIPPLLSLKSTNILIDLILSKSDIMAIIEESPSVIGPINAQSKLCTIGIKNGKIKIISTPVGPITIKLSPSSP